jgi:hypothetical protein
MLSNGVRRIYTYQQHFSRFQGIEALTPESYTERLGGQRSGFVF